MVLCLSLFCVPNVASFSGLSIFDGPVSIFLKFFLYYRWYENLSVDSLVLYGHHVNSVEVL